MKRVIYSLLEKAGYSLSKLEPPHDVDLYRQLFSTDSIEKRRFYNIGAGNFYHPCWTNIDKNPPVKFKVPDYAFVNHDLFSTNTIPLESNTAEVVYSSHTLGHLDNDAVRNTLNESYRLLKKNGCIRIVTADADMMFNAWKSNDLHFFYWRNLESMNRDYQKFGLKIPLNQASITQLFIEEITASASDIACDGSSERVTDEKFMELLKHKSYEEALDYCASLCPRDLQEKYPFRHMNWFNEKKLRNMLEEAGFRNVQRSHYLQSGQHILRNPYFFDKTTPQLSLYMEACK
jgi:ubiquinone/menaquinone biosynthesis C-methylase UbiE